MLQIYAFSTDNEDTDEKQKQGLGSKKSEFFFYTVIAIVDEKTTRSITKSDGIRVLLEQHDFETNRTVNLASPAISR